jgi:hypothetical protein
MAERPIEDQMALMGLISGVLGAAGVLIQKLVKGEKK